MFNPNDFSEKKILVIFPSGELQNQLKFGNSNLKLYREGKVYNQISLFQILCVFLIGEFTITSQLIKKFREHGISLFLINKSFKFYGFINSEAEGNTEIRSIQYCMPDKKSHFFSQILVKNKIQNQYSLIKNYIKLTPKFNLEDEKCNPFNNQTNEKLLGLEGNISSKYFKLIFKESGWYRRAPTTKEDITNLLLDIGYTFLFNFCDSLLRLFGFDTYKGFYHRIYFQRKSLSCDIMEPIRVLIDKAILKAYSLDQIDKKDFSYKNAQFSFKNYEVQKKYINIFTSIIVKNKDEIYDYILQWYRYFHDQEKYQTPNFKIKF